MSESGIGVLDTVLFRQKLAGLIDPAEKVAASLETLGKENAVRFVATLPMLFGRDLERTTLWDRIASAIETAYSKTADADYEFFVSEVLRHIKAKRGAAASSYRLGQVLDLLRDASATERQGWLDYLTTHIDVVLVHARRQWVSYRDQKSAGADVSWWGEQIDFDAIAEAEGGDSNA